MDFGVNSFHSQKVSLVLLPRQMIWKEIFQLFVHLKVTLLKSDLHNIVLPNILVLMIVLFIAHYRFPSLASVEKMHVWVFIHF